MLTQAQICARVFLSFIVRDLPLLMRSPSNKLVLVYSVW